MRLKRLELFGFKSFADRTVLDFGDNRLTGIVGPNGCGKSNVVDAVRWVLGETRPTSMRGTGMTDVIFKGSASRPGMSVAEATLVFDNRDAVLETRGAEVAITRRLYKSGEGEYLIDGERVRLKDVRDLLFDTGLGSRGYAVLEQGKIDAVLSANPVQRRSIFEEAAGISRYRQRRHEAELRLKRVEQDVTRLDDVMGELRTRARSLKIQAGKAERYLAAREEWTVERTRWLRHALAGQDRGLADLAPELERLERELGELRALRSECEAEVALREEERSSVVAELDRLAGESGHLAGELRALDERRSQLAMRVASWRASAVEERERAAVLEQSLGERRAAHERMQRELAELEARLERARGSAGGLAGQVRELGASYRDVRRSVEQQNEVVLERLHERTAAQNRERHLEESRALAAERLERLAARGAEAEATCARCAQELAAVRAGDEAAAAALAGLEHEHAGLGTRLAEVEVELEERRGERAALELERAGLAARIEALRDREAEQATLSDGARRVLEAVQQGDGPCAAGALLGLVADHVQVDVRLARALDVALGERAQALVAADAHVALDVLDWLARERGGQVGLVVPRGMDAPERPAPGDASLLARHGNGVEGRLAALVRCDERMRPLVDALLADVIVVADLARALQLVGEEPAWRFVTPQGELVDAGGLVGGHREVTAGAVGRRSSAADLEGRRDALDASLRALSDGARELEGRREDLRAELIALEARREAARRERAEAQGALATAAARLEDQRAARGELAGEERRAREEAEQGAAELGQARAAREAAEAAFAEENRRLEEMEGGRRALEEQRESLARDESRAQVELARLASERDALAQRGTDAERRIEEELAEIERARTRAADYDGHAAGGEQDGERIAQQSARVLEERGQLEERLGELRAVERSGAERIREVRGRAEETQRALDAAGEALSQRKLERQRLELAREELLGRAREELSLTPADLRADFERDPELAAREGMAALEARVAELRAALDRLGPVNTDAVEELDEVQGRLDFLESQSGDLAEARRTLNDTIARIDAESRRLFTETFEEVRANFQGVFRKLFGGGRADLRLEEGVDVLEAGIDILARPPGREMLPIGLLSGGQRTMTALALLFAVFEARPSPFCVLDEVDAALDDANIDRFLGMLEGFLESTQFIVVTHNKGTMSACEALFGVTMQVKGVSKHVTVELDEVDEFAPETTGRARGDRPAPPAERPAEEPGDDPPARPRDAESGEPVVELVPREGARAPAPEPEPQEVAEGAG